jgi:hypothetical protein
VIYVELHVKGQSDLKSALYMLETWGSFSTDLLKAIRIAIYNTVFEGTKILFW